MNRYERTPVPVDPIREAHEELRRTMDRRLYIAIAQLLLVIVATVAVLLLAVTR